MIQTVRDFRKVGPVHVPWLRLWSVSDFPAAKSPVALHLDTTLISHKTSSNLHPLNSLWPTPCLLTLRTSWQYALPRNVHPRDLLQRRRVQRLSYSLVTVTAGGVGAQLFRRRYASAAQIRP